jgi:hypothetical protein
MAPSLIGVVPEGAHAGRPRLFAALERAFPVQFVGRRPGDWRNLDGLIGVGTEVFADVARSGVPSLCTGDTSRGYDPAGCISFDRLRVIHPCLRGGTLSHSGAAGFPLLDVTGQRVLASGPRGPVWTMTTDGRTARVPAPLPELDHHERLKDHLRAGVFLPLLPLVHFLRELTATEEPSHPPLRASLIIDDPNLHWPSYGYLRYADLHRDAEQHGYHVGIAMVPLDSRFAVRSVLTYFGSDSPLSLLVHGNNHAKRELQRLGTVADGVASAAQALRRIAAFEHRYSVAVERVMVPPHDDYLPAPEDRCHPRSGACSQVAMRGLLLTGFDGVCYYGPSDVDDPLIGWGPADSHLNGCVPGLHRLPLEAPVDELVLRAFLDQPIVLFGHHAHLADPDVLTEAANRVMTLGAVHWMALGDVLRGNFFTRQDGGLLKIEAHARRMDVTVPQGVTELSVTLGAQEDDGQELVSVLRPGQVPVAGRVGEPLAVRAEGRVQLTIEDPQCTDPANVPAPRWHPWFMVRRCLTEGRDRALPFVRPRRRT